MARRARGEGSVWQAKDGRWRGRATINGVTITVSGMTADDARNKLRMRSAKVLTGDGDAAPKATVLTVNAWAAEWLQLCTAKMRRDKLKPSTLEGYANVLELYVLPGLGSVPLSKLTAVHVTGWHEELLNGGGKHKGPKKPGTVAAAHRVLRAMLREAQRQGHVSVNVAAVAGGPGGVEPVHDFLTIEEVGRVVAAFDGSREAAAVALGLLGLRRGEIAGLSWSDVDLDRGLVTIREAVVAVAGRGVRGTPKRRASYRTITTDEALLDALRRWKANQTAERLKAGPLWTATNSVITTRHGKVMDPTSMGRTMTRFVLKAAGRAVSPHALRHTSASLMYDAGADLKAISEHLGHGDVSVTEKVYTHLLSEARRRGGDALGRALKAAADTPR